jgi:hypothetical protein
MGRWLILAGVCALILSPAYGQLYLIQGSPTPKFNERYATTLLQVGADGAVRSASKVLPGGLAGTQRHEYNSSNPALSHYGEYQTSLNTNNPTDYIEGQVAPPGTDGTAFSNNAQTQYQALLTQIMTDSSNEPLGTNYDANGNFLGYTNFAPNYTSCN